MTVTFEDRQALAARAQLLGVLRDEFGAAVTELARAPEGGGPATLRHLERNLFEPDSTAVPPDGSLRLLEGAGDRGEAELLGRKIARLLADGVDPDEIAIAVRNPDRQAPSIAATLGRLGIPLAPEASVPLAMTATGSSLFELLAIVAGEGRRRRSSRCFAARPGHGPIRSTGSSVRCCAGGCRAPRRRSPNGPEPARAHAGSGRWTPCAKPATIARRSPAR